MTGQKGLTASSGLSTGDLGQVADKSLATVGIIPKKTAPSVTPLSEPLPNGFQRIDALLPECLTVSGILNSAIQRLWFVHR
jgi:hypothetical protein